MNAALTRLSIARRARLAICEQELAYMEHHAPAALSRQRAALLKLRREVDPRSSDQIRRDVERRAKANLLH